MGDGEGCRTHESGEGVLIAYLHTYRGFNGYLWRSLNLIKKVLALVCERDVFSLRSFKFVLFVLTADSGEKRFP
jgi:hypothetical protein